jgi:hypothetical protein
MRNITRLLGMVNNIHANLEDKVRQNTSLRSVSRLLSLIGVLYVYVCVIYI